MFTPNPSRLVHPVLLLACLASSAQAQLTETSAKTWGAADVDYTTSIHVGPNGDLYLSGLTRSFGAGEDALLLKYDSSGKFQWARVWDSGKTDKTAGRAYVAGDGIYMSGYTPGASDDDVLLLRFDLDGTSTLATTWDSGTAEHADTVFSDSANNLYLAGGTGSGGPAGENVLLMKYPPAPSAATQPSVARAWGGDRDESINGGVVDGSSGTEFVYVVGSTTSFGAGLRDVLVQKYTSALDLVWSRTWGGPGRENACGVTVDADGNVYVVGATHGFGGVDFDAVLLKWSSAGDLLWARVWRASGDEDVREVTVGDCAQNVYVAGGTSGFDAGGMLDGLLIKFDPQGNVQWSKTWGADSQQDAIGKPIVATGLLRVTGATSCVPGVLVDRVGTVFDPLSDVVQNQDAVAPIDLALGAPVDVSRPATAPAPTACQSLDSVLLEFSTSGPAASVVTRNVAPNVVSYTALAPVLGECWSGTVDLTTTGHSLAVVLGYDSPGNMTLAGGQVVLMGGTELFKLLPLTPGPQATWSFVMPYDIVLLGLTAYTQAVHLGGVTPFALSNAQDMTVGF